MYTLYVCICVQLGGVRAWLVHRPHGHGGPDGPRLRACAAFRPAAAGAGLCSRLPCVDARHGCTGLISFHSYSRCALMGDIHRAWQIAGRGWGGGVRMFTSTSYVGSSGTAGSGREEWRGVCRYPEGGGVQFR
ncbi:hypothetical protein EDC01DRAFT_653162 [Geopyxis carbonaria]|nr:hypothetical protein EDC01DRAFT_653162 [Geopyxis carbonaria]